MVTYTFDKFEISLNRNGADLGNYGDGLPPGHYQSIMEMTRDRLNGFYSKGLGSFFKKNIATLVMQQALCHVMLIN